MPRGLSVVAAAILVLSVGGCGGGDGGQEIGHIPWRLAGVSADARMVEVAHVFPQCATEAAKAVVREDPRSVTIRVPEITVAGMGGDVSCNSSQRIGVEAVRLASALGRRTLVNEPGASGDPAVEAPLIPGQPEAEECARLDKLAADAPARDVPWVTKRLELCASER